MGAEQAGRESGPAEGSVGIYKKTAAYGHFGRAPEADGSFSWEKTDMVNVFKKEVQ